MAKIVTHAAWQEHMRSFRRMDALELAYREEGQRVVEGSGDMEKLRQPVRDYMAAHDEVRAWWAEHSETWGPF